VVRFESPARPRSLRFTGPACGRLYGPQREIIPDPYAVNLAESLRFSKEILMVFAR